MRQMDATWFTKAACRGADNHPFYPENGERAAGAKAKEICSRCPVQSECLIFAITHYEQEGIWGGLRQPERRRFRRLIGWKPPVACGTTEGFTRHMSLGEEPCERCRAARRKYKAEHRAKQRKLHWANTPKKVKRDHHKVSAS